MHLKCLMNNIICGVTKFGLASIKNTTKRGYPFFAIVSVMTH